MDMRIFGQLNPQQLLAVKNIHGPLMILAGAGTGKTKVITHRIAYMLHEGIAPKSLVAVTFTNKAAREMRERVEALVGKRASSLSISTFHSFCLFLLRTYPVQAGLHKNFSLIGTSEQLDLVRKSLEEKRLGNEFRAEDLLARISRAKNNLLSPSDLGDLDSVVPGIFPPFVDADPQLLRIVYNIYERQLSLNRVIDFDDCIFRAARLLEQNEAIRSEVQEKLRFFLVDEYQDTNFSQLRLLELLASASQNVCVVGDDDQSIYSWRGAMAETIEKFEIIFKNTKIIKLEQNYRCSNIILGAANHVIKNNSKRKEKTLWSQNNITEKIVVTSHKTDQDEATWIANKCLGLFGQGFQPKDAGILYRANSQAKALEFAMREAKIPYKVFGGSSFFEKKEVKDFLAYLKLCGDHDDRLSFFRILNTPSRGFGLKSLEKIESKAQQLKLSPFAILAGHPPDDFTLPMKKAAENFSSSIASVGMMPLHTAQDLEFLGQKIIAEFHLEDDIRQRTSDKSLQSKKIDSLRRLPQWLKQIFDSDNESFLMNGSINLGRLVDHICLGDNQENTKNTDAENFVSLMTIHSAKGLEFSHVFICGVEENLLPHRNSIESPQGLEEERRLFYVALTRAKQRLFISYANERSSGYQREERAPSQFLAELPQEYVFTELCDTSTGELERKKKNLAQLNLIKTKLSSKFF